MNTYDDLLLYAECGLFILLLGGLAAYVIWYQSWRFKRADALIEKWASEEGYQVILKEHAQPEDHWPGLPRYGPFRGTFLMEQLVYKVLIGNAGGKRRWCWIRLGESPYG